MYKRFESSDKWLNNVIKFYEESKLNISFNFTSNVLFYLYTFDYFINLFPPNKYLFYYLNFIIMNINIYFDLFIFTTIVLLFKLHTISFNNTNNIINIFLQGIFNTFSAISLCCTVAAIVFFPLAACLITLLRFFTSACQKVIGSVNV